MSTAPPIGVPVGLPAPVPGTAVDPTAPARPARSGRRDAAARALSGTPGRMRIAAALAVLGSLVFGLLGGSAFQAWGAALDDARANAAQLVRIQTIQNDLVKADATAATNYLTGGSSVVPNQTLYDAAISNASRSLARPSPDADTAALQQVNDGLTRYTALVAQAQVNNRFGLQVGAAYQRQAGEVLRTQIVPALEKVSAADQRRVSEAYDAANAATARLIAAAVVALVLLLGAQLWLSRRTHRVVNVPLALATLAVLGASLGGAASLNNAAGIARGVASNSYASAVNLATARTAAFDAKAQEAFGLIARGNAKAAEDIATKRIATAETTLRTGKATEGSRQNFAAWVKAHGAVRAADDKGSWVAARDLALTTSTTVFDAFDQASKSELDGYATTVDSSLGGARSALIIMGWFVLACGLIAAGATYTGFAQRLGEYR